MKKNEASLSKFIHLHTGLHLQVFLAIRTSHMLSDDFLIYIRFCSRYQSSIHVVCMKMVVGRYNHRRRRRRHLRIVLCHPPEAILLRILTIK